MTTPSAADRLISPRQRGVVMRHFARLGLTDKAWRPYRLAITAVLAGRETLGSVNELHTDEAGRVLGVLTRCRDCRDLAALMADRLTSPE